MKEFFLIFLLFLSTIHSQDDDDEDDDVWGQFRIYGFEISVNRDRFVKIQGKHYQNGTGAFFLFANHSSEAGVSSTLFEIGFLTEYHQVYTEWVDPAGERHKETKDTDYYFQNGYYTVIFNVTGGKWLTLNAAGEIFFDKPISFREITYCEVWEVIKGSVTVESIDIKFGDHENSDYWDD